MAAKDLTPDELLETIPMAFPMTHLLDDFPGVAKYPIDAWEEAGAPAMTSKSWVKLCVRVAQNDLTNLQHIMDIAQKLDK